IPVKGGASLSWEMSAVVISGVADVGLRFNWISAANLPLTPTTADLPLSGSWATIGGSVNVPANAARVTIQMFRGGGGSGRALATHISVKHISDATTIIRPESIFSPLLASNSVTTEKLAARAVTADKADFNSFSAVEGYVSR